eukprot:TRINITY_DN7220_c0_g1_i3.p1 TRINITY_DN7220_c0_g1~~TRINITY_DN7220_c0_g1_i3.p1  ORF type:complete len:378 (+),score=65.02 TRINITY_DN7220_c0_g1_i3:194-1327(+)
MEESHREVKELLESTLVVMSASTCVLDYNTSPKTKGVDPRTMVFAAKLLETDLFLPSNTNQETLDQFESNLQYHLNMFLAILSRESLKVLSRGQLCYWMKQVSYLIEIVLEGFPHANRVTGGHNILNQGIYVSISSATQYENQHERLVGELCVILLELYKTFLELTYSRTAPDLIKYVYTDHEKETNNGDPDVSQKHGHSYGYDSTFTTTVLTTYSKLLKHLRHWHNYSSVILQFFHQVYDFTDVMLFNELLKHPERYCNSESGLQIKLILSQMEDWKLSNLKLHAPSGVPLRVYGTLDFMTQASNLMVLEKSIFVDPTILAGLFPKLSLDHIYYLLQRFQASKLSPSPVPSSLLRQLWSMGARTVDVNALLVQRYI